MNRIHQSVNQAARNVARKIASPLLLLNLSLFLIPIGQADQVYKITDPDGNITYSTVSPDTIQGESVEVIDTGPEPSAEDIEAANQALERELEIEREKQQRREQAALEQQRSQPSNTQIVVHDQTIIVGEPVYRSGRRHRGGRLADGAATAPGYRPGRPAHLPSHN